MSDIADAARRTRGYRPGPGLRPIALPEEQERRARAWFDLTVTEVLDAANYWRQRRSSLEELPWWRKRRSWAADYAEARENADRWADRSLALTLLRHED